MGIRVAAAATGSSLRKRLRNPPRFLSGAASPGASGGGAHSSPRRAGASGAALLVLDQGAASASPSRGGVAVGAHAFAGASVAAGEGVIHEAVEDDGCGCAPQGSSGAVVGAGSAAEVGGDGGGAFAAGPGAKMPVRDARRSSIAGGTCSRGGGGASSRFGLSRKRSASSAWRSGRTSVGGAGFGSAAISLGGDGVHISVGCGAVHSG